MRRKRVLSVSCALIALLTLTAFADTPTIDPILDSLALFGINQTSGQMSRYDFATGTTRQVGMVRDHSGNPYTGIKGSAYIPGHQNIISFWTDPGSNLARMLYVDVETAKAALVGNDLGPGKITGAVAAETHGTVMIKGQININPNNSPDNEFVLITAGGTTYTRDDLHQDSDVDGNGVFYQGNAGYVRVKPKGNGSQNELLINFQPFILTNNNTYVFTGNMGVKVYNDHMNNGKAMGKWYIEFTGGETIMQGVEGTARWGVYAVQKVEAAEDETVDFNIVGDKVVPSESFAAKVTVLGAAITYGGQYNLMVTTKFKVGGTTYEPFGSFDQAYTANVNDNNNPRHYIFPGTFPGGTAIDVIGRSWTKKKSNYSGSNNNHWQTYMTVDSSWTNSQQLIVLRNGDNVPNFTAFQNQASIASFIQDYIDTNTNKVVLDENQAICLFELGTTNMSSEAADFQDLVVLVTLAKDPSDFAEADDDDNNAGTAARLLMIDHRTGGYAQVMTLNREYDGLASTDGNIFYASHANELWRLDVANQTETLVGSMPASDMHGLEFAGSTLIGFGIVADKVYPMDIATGAIIGTSANIGMFDLGTITFMPVAEDPALQPKFYD